MLSSRNTLIVPNSDRAVMRDALTGTPITAQFIINLSDFSGPQTNRKPIPRNVTSSRMVVPTEQVSTDNLGSLEWDRRFQAYLMSEKDDEREEAKRLWYCWETEAYLVGRVRKHYPQADALDPVLALYRDKWEWVDVRRKWNHTLRWIDRHYTRMTAFVRNTYLFTERQILRESAS